MVIGFLLALSLMPAPSVAEDVCPGHYSQLTSRVFRDMRDRIRGRETINKQIKAAIADGFEARAKNGKPFPKDWVKWEDLSDEQLALLERLPRLTPEEREATLKLVRETKPRSAAGGRYRQLFLLGLYDEYSWTRLASDPEKFPAASRMAGKYLEVAAPNMPEKLKTEVLTASGARYEELADAMERGSSAPKQAVDAYFRQLLRGEDLILAEIKKGKSPKEAFAAYFDKVHSYIKASAFYSSDDALKTVKHVQIGLRHKVQKGLRGKGGAEPVIYIGGGIPNGRATLTHADMDIGGNFDLSMVGRRDLEIYVAKQATEVDPRANLQLMLRSQSPNYWEKQHPVMFKVRASSIEMMVYDRKGNYRSFKME